MKRLLGKHNKPKPTWPLVGNENVINYLEKSIAADDLEGSYIFSGEAGLGKAAAARFFAAAVLCREADRGNKSLPCARCASCAGILERDRPLHGDLSLVRRAEGKKNISIEQVRGLVEAMQKTSYQGSYKIGLVEEADTLSPGAANALLKTLEEPRPEVLVILTAVDRGRLLPTIVSRSRVLDFYPSSFDKIYDFLVQERGVARSEARIIAAMSGGRPGPAIELSEDKEKRRYQEKWVNVFLSFWGQDINRRLSALDDMLPAKFSGVEAGCQAARILSLWQTSLRDCLLAGYGQYDLIRNQFAAERIKKLRPPAGRLLNIFEVLRDAEKQIEANVPARFVLDNVAIHV